MAGKNTRDYGWSECEIRLIGTMLTGVEGVSWNVKQAKEAIYGKGNEPQKIKRGNKSYEGSLSVLQDELEQILDVAPDGQIVNLQDLDLQIAYEENGVIVRYSLIGVEFTEEPHESKQGDLIGRAVLPFLFLREIRI
ncbi:hypothetical protein [Dyadobacter frigoris]|uniref:Phage tail protein n=1 Tax=Dyadobacter frigoris TaxID=2576211 RepID=A0A4U6CYN6_9BACT|nr:hypothetical protein [Dyadobacter frigoris]TKT89476.1 hypothetical protein FDK13_24345 [Dyadobacter frigoris]